MVGLLATPLKMPAKITRFTDFLMGKTLNVETSYENAFAAAVPTSFASIMADFGLTLTRVNEWMLELKSQHCLVILFLERQQVFVDVKPVRLDQVPSGRYFRGLDLSIMISCLDPKTKFKYRSIEAENMNQEIDRLAEHLRQYCTPLLSGNFSDWPKLVECQEKGSWRTA